MSNEHAGDLDGRDRRGEGSKERRKQEDTGILNVEERTKRGQAQKPS